MPMAINSEPEKYVRCLVSINRLGIGFDCPDVVLGVQLRPTMVRSLYIQQVSRQARTSRPLDKVLSRISDKIKYF
jgi:superfamily II DNA or RNA helicase